MRWMLFAALSWSLGAGGGNLQERLAHRVDHGWIVTVLEIDRDVALPSEKQLLAVLKIEPPGAEPVWLTFNDAQAALFTVEGVDGNAAYSSSWRLAPGEQSKSVPRSGWSIHLRIPFRSAQGKRLPSGRYILQTRLLVTPELENRIAFQVR